MPPVLQTDGIDVVDVIPLFLFANAKEKGGQKEKGFRLATLCETSPLSLKSALNIFFCESGSFRFAQSS